VAYPRLGASTISAMAALVTTTVAKLGENREEAVQLSNYLFHGGGNDVQTLMHAVVCW